MNCQEVMDYMQRQLDGDLDDRETEILMNHTRHCSDCAAMFERLKLLSSGLENLPKVVPSYSLVDAILPKLAELQPTASEPAVPLPNIVIGGVEPASPRRTAKKAESGWRRWLPLTAGGGVVAAGVLIGMFFLSNQNMHSVRDSANSAANMTADASNATADDSASNSVMTNSATSESTGSAPARHDEKADSGVTTKRAADDSAKGDQIAKGLSQSVDPNGEPMPPITGGAQDQSTVDPQAMSPNESFVVNSTNDTADADSAADSGTASDGAAGGAALNSQKPSTSSSNSADGSAAAGSNAASNTGSNTGSKGGGNQTSGSNDTNNNTSKNVTGTNAIMASPISPNKQYQAFIVEDAVSIYTVSDSVPVFLGAKRSGISDLKWSEDSKQLTYVAVQADGSKVTYIVDPQAGTEQAQSSK